MTQLRKPTDVLATEAANTPKQVLIALVDLNEVYHGHFERVISEMHGAMDLLREGVT